MKVTENKDPFEQANELIAGSGLNVADAQVFINWVAQTSSFNVNPRDAEAESLKWKYSDEAWRITGENLTLQNLHITIQALITC